MYPSWTALVSGEAMIVFPVEDYEKTANENAARILAGVSALARKADISCATVHAKDQYPADGILDTAKKNHCDLIVMRKADIASASPIDDRRDQSSRLRYEREITRQRWLVGKAGVDADARQHQAEAIGTLDTQQVWPRGL